MGDRRCEVRIYAAKINHIVNPLGFDLPHVTASWKVAEAFGKKQEAARLCVFGDAGRSRLLYDSGWDAALSSLGTELPLTLLPRTRYYWTVRVRSDAGEEAESELCFFETAKLEEPWAAGWITPQEDTERHPLFCRTVRPEEGREVVSARLYVCGLGLYVPYWNGKKIGSEYLTPYCNHYAAWVQYQTYDLTEELRAGSGEIGILLGDGWYKGRFSGRGRFGGPWTNLYGNRRQMIAEIRIRYADGTESVIGSDESWMVKRSRVTSDGIYDGEKEDGTLPELPPSPARPAREPEGKLTPRRSLPVRVQEILPARRITTPAGDTVFDLGQNIGGIFRLRVHEPRGTRIYLQFGEILQKGEFYRGNLGSARQEFEYISDGEAHVLEPRFTFYGYRYAKVTVTGPETEGAAHIGAEDFCGLALSSDLERTGRVKTGHALLNRLILNAVWSQTGNFIDVPTDCPQRSERMGWTGDAQVFSGTACLLKDCSAFYDKYLYDMRLEQQERGGRVPDTVPSFFDPRTSAIWGDAAVIIPSVLYRMSGDLSALREQYPGMRAWCECMIRADGTDKGWRKEKNIGGWLALDGTDGCHGATDKPFLSDVYFRSSLLLTAEAAVLLGYPAEADCFRAKAAELLERIRSDFFTPEGICSIDTQTAHLLALRDGLTLDPAAEKAALLRLLDGSGGKMLSGFVGTNMFCEMLDRIGEPERALSLLLNEEFPGWLFSVKMGATTIWERWNSVTEDGIMFCEKPENKKLAFVGMNSLNHYAFGAMVSWVFERIAGLRQAEGSTGCREMLVRPLFSERIGSAEASLDTAAGLWEIAWKPEEDGAYSLRLRVPFGCRAVLDADAMETLPESCLRGAQGRAVLEAGEYFLRCRKR